ncbi:MAG: tetraacyldisaccharide 4'-kinase [Gammaproteobacteria bacterium]|nr:tetraacyldisaccharide 4'-kinase [Gammaproteobacteria bacterium]
MSAGLVKQGSGERWLLDRWYGPEPVLWLRPLEAMFRLLVALRRWAYKVGLLKTLSPGVPVLVVGNITVGGTGKTPLVLHLAKTLKQRGIRVGIVSRGYGGTGELRLVKPDSLAADVGDEPLLLARRSDVPVCVGRDRVAAARKLVAMGVQCIISDDGLQHYRLARQIQIAVLDGRRGLGNGACLPAGPLREPVQRLAQMDLVVVNGSEVENIPDVVVMNLEPDGVLPVNGNTPPRTLQSFAGETVHALAGIGNPERFFESLRRQGISVLPRPMSDHSTIEDSDLVFPDKHEILMTEKDAVKCVGYFGTNSWYVPVTASFSDPDQTRLNNLLDRFLTDLPGSD